MTTYRYTDETNTVVNVIDDDGLSRSSCLVSVLPEDSVIEPYVSPPPAPVTQVTMRQARLALNTAGLLPSVNAAVAAATEAVKIEWEFASELKRDWPTLVLLSSALGLTKSQVDDLFTLAATL